MPAWKKQFFIHFCPTSRWTLWTFSQTYQPDRVYQHRHLVSSPSKINKLFFFKKKTNKNFKFLHMAERRRTLNKVVDKSSDFEFPLNPFNAGSLFHPVYLCHAWLQSYFPQRSTFYLRCASQTLTAGGPMTPSGTNSSLSFSHHV